MASLPTLTEVRNESKRTGKSFEQVFKEQTGREVEVRKPEVRTQQSFVKGERSLLQKVGSFPPRKTKRTGGLLLRSVDG